MEHTPAEQRHQDPLACLVHVLQLALQQCWRPGSADQCQKVQKLC